jgi:hypothetical protein
VSGIGTRRRRRFGVGFVVVAGLTVLAGELTARFAVGLGDPPLTVRDPEIDYMFAPGTYERFGNTIRYNSYHMRADEPPSPDFDGPRVLVLGDSVINGGALTNHADLATALLQQRVRETHGDGWVGHISAGSWGPANLLAYVERFGWFDADLAVIVLNGGDLEDLPGFRRELGADFPTRRPVSALSELLTRYVPRYLPVLEPVLGEQPSVPTRTYANPAAAGRAAFEDLLETASADVPAVVVLLHPGRDAVRAHAPPDPARWRRLLAVTDPAGIVALPMDDVLRERTDAYRDGIHINALGQRIYADTLICLAEHALEHGTFATCTEAAAP